MLEIASFGKLTDFLQAKSLLDSADIKYVLQNENIYNLTHLNSSLQDDRVKIFINKDYKNDVIKLFEEFGLEDYLNL